MNLIPTKEAAKIMHCNARTIRRWIYTDKLNAMKFPKCWMVIEDKKFEELAKEREDKNGRI